MSAEAALQAARRAGVVVTLDDGELSLSAKSPPPSAVLEMLAAHKGEILALLQAGNDDRAEAEHDAWLGGVRVANLDTCRFCGERIAWKLDGVALADRTAAHGRCYEEAAAKGPWW